MTQPLTDQLIERAAGACELCGQTEDLNGIEAAGSPTGAEPWAVTCRTCSTQICGDTELDPKHWFCLQESIWSEVAAVQVLAYRLLNQLRHESWAADLLEQVYLDEDTLAWAEAGLTPTGEAAVATVDSNGAPLADGDSVTLIKGLDVKGANFTAKRGTLVKNIRLSDDPELVEGRVNGVGIYLKTCFLKKAN